jgi:isocitrate/isopropylmalate dehydrogenase
VEADRPGRHRRRRRSAARGHERDREKADAILFGSAGMPGDEEIPFMMRPGGQPVAAAQGMGLFANFRPASCFPN